MIAVYIGVTVTVGHTPLSAIVNAVVGAVDDESTSAPRPASSRPRYSL